MSEVRLKFCHKKHPLEHSFKNKRHYWECRDCSKIRFRRYLNSEKCKIVKRRYNHSEKGEATNRRHAHSEHGRARYCRRMRALRMGAPTSEAGWKRYMRDLKGDDLERAYQLKSWLSR